MTPPAVPDHLRFAAKALNPGEIPHLGRRYDASGTFLTERGNTIVCHLVEGSDSAAAVLDLRGRYGAMPGAETLAFTAASSLHMTLFQGIIESRRAHPYWPADVPVETPVDDMTALMSDRLALFAPGPAFNVVLSHLTPLGLQLEGATEADKTVLREWRDRLADLLGYRHPDHDTYVFHITFAYMTERFDEETMAAWIAFLAEAETALKRHAPVFALKAPAFCTFEDMNHFEEVQVFEPA
ncbi:hypothetical protein SAMN05880582_1011243 [Rhizobium sp. RU20A]|uniref:DUF1868 domain-containing protein n=1 Tax=Rhizobium sp. RU20A TaxID=1907412 RepID=UPI000954293D|nr:DUF1868 domain-containing protein [Rhizobium sp. RU20A]SIQ25024.1 hypothetical protein SAMN05880582_1011243 [Rhizobium sp. RU20A]